MTALKVFHDDNPSTPIFDSDTLAETDKIEKITYQLKQVSVRFEQWQTIESLKSGATQEEVLTAYQREVDKLIFNR
jgi:1,2-dihydroxy-3-keto-5-methylthiopentene dioxygenase